MGTNRSSETLAEAEYLRSRRTTTQEEVMAQGRDHKPLMRFSSPPDRHSPSAH